MNRPVDSSFPFWLLSLLCVAAGFLTKWTAPAFFYMTVVPLLIWRRRMAAAPGLAAPGRTADRGRDLHRLGGGGGCESAGWDVLYQTVRAEALQHLSPAHQHEPYPWAEALTFPIRILAANLPLSAFAIFTLRPGFMERWNPGQQRVLQAMHCWVWPSLHLLEPYPRPRGAAQLPACRRDWRDWRRWCGSRWLADTSPKRCKASLAVAGIDLADRESGARRIDRAAALGPSAAASQGRTAGVAGAQAGTALSRPGEGRGLDVLLWRAGSPSGEFRPASLAL